MPHNQKPKQLEAVNGNALQWKNSLLTKEEPEEFQNPLNYFSRVIQDYDTFSNIFEDILGKRETGDTLEYFDGEIKEIRSVEAFLVVQDPRGVNWICPVNVDSDNIDHHIRPLNIQVDKDQHPIRTMESFGTITMSGEDYLSSCSRGFENAGRLLLGDESVKLNIGFGLIAAFYLMPKTK